jgi:nicotinamidase-related amidase
MRKSLSLSKPVGVCPRFSGAGGVLTFLTMQRPVLIVIDMLNDFLEKWAPAQKQPLIRSINDLVGLMRQRGYPIIWVRQEFEPDLRDAFPEMKAKGIRISIKGTAGCEIASDLARIPSDPVVIKKRYSAFFATELDQILQRLTPDALILAGINTHACVRVTAIDAYQRDWKVVVAADCVDSYDREHHDISMKYMKDKIATVMTNQEIHSALAADRGVPAAKEAEEKL